MTTTINYGLIRTIQVRNENVPGVLGALASAIGSAGANIGNLQTVHISQNHVLRDIDVQVRDLEHLASVLDAIEKLQGVEVIETRDEVLGLHRGGKIEMVSRHPVDTIAMLRKVYTPGVADVCRRIAERPDRKRLYTAIHNMVAIVTDGTAVLGLGNIGLAPSMPVMEGKAALLHQFAGVSGVPILLDATDVDEFVETVMRISPTFGGIHLEDIASPRCFDIVDKLRERLDIPVMQDDQDGTAAVVLSAVLNAGRITGRDLSKQVIGQIGLGAAGQAVAKLLMHHTGNSVLGADLDGESLERHKGHGGTPSTLEEIMGKADIVIATTGVNGLIKPEMVRNGQIILGLSNPDSEIDPQDAMDAGAVLAADGRSVNNVLGYPGIWKGALASRATQITRDMLIAAAEALAACSGPNELSPSPLDLEVHRRVAYAVARSAAATGVGVTVGAEALEGAAR
ncbi:MAG: malic enzyme-like NAD(P)-binding protein [Dehalococcoidia bacterium]